MAKIRVKLEENRHIFIHNDLSNAAFHFKERIVERLRSDDQEGIALEMMAGLVMTAFALEAKINFLGFKIVENWNERERYKDKVQLVCDSLGVELNWDERPFSTLNELKKFRDTLAHGKPDELQRVKEMVVDQAELDARGLLTAKWEKYLEESFVVQAYDDMNALWKDLLDQSGLHIFETMTGGSHTVSFIEHVDE